MARDQVVRGVNRIFALAQESEHLGTGIERDVENILRTSLAPILTRARTRYLSRPTFGVQAAATVKIEYSKNAVLLQTGDPSYPWGATEFGAGTRVINGREVDYSTRFGKHLGQTGYAFVPAVRLGLGRVNREADKYVDTLVGRLADAAGG